MRGLILSASIAGVGALAFACAPRHADPIQPEGASAPGPIVEPASTTAPTRTPAPEAGAPLEPEAAYVAVFEALRDGDWDAFSRFAGAASIEVRRQTSVGEAPPERTTVAPERAQAWLGELSATWAPACAERPDPPCRGLNPLSLGVEPEQLELRCAEVAGGLCCSHDAPLLHNTPFLVEVCLDSEQRVTTLAIVDG